MLGWMSVTGVTPSTAGAVVEALLVKQSVEEAGKVPGVSIIGDIPRHHVFVCSHVKRDKRCGLIGPYLKKELTRLIAVSRRR